MANTDEQDTRRLMEMARSESSELLHLLVHHFPARQALMRMLRPLDIISLVLATGIQLTDAEKAYLNVSRQLFFDLTWVEDMEKNGRMATLFSNDLMNLHNAIRSWDESFRVNDMRVLLVVREFEKKHDCITQTDEIVKANMETVRLSTEFRCGIPLRSWCASDYRDTEHFQGPELCVLSVGPMAPIGIRNFWPQHLPISEPLASRYSKRGLYRMDLHGNNHPIQKLRGYIRPYRLEFGDPAQADLIVISRRMGAYERKYSFNRIGYLLEVFDDETWQRRLARKSR
jgi:hypothetical protein